MTANPPEPVAAPRPASRNAWPWVVTFLGLAALLIFAGLWTFHRVTSLPGGAVDKGLAVLHEVSRDAATVASAFQRRNIHQEFLSSAVKLEGTNRLQVATLQENETFRRQEQDTIAWGWIALPPVVVQADVPVEYTYYLDFQAPWDFSRENTVITVRPPAIRANTPAADISKLAFYTLGGHVWQDDKSVRDRLQGSLSLSLRERATEHVPLVREMARRQTENFVRKWLGETYRDGRNYEVKISFPDETGAALESEIGAANLGPKKATR